MSFFPVEETDGLLTGTRILSSVGSSPWITRECLDLLSHHGILLPASSHFLLGLSVDKLLWNFKFYAEKCSECMVNS